MALVEAAAATVSTIKAAFDIGKGVQSLHTSVEVDQAVAEMLEKLLTARQQAMESLETETALLKRIDELEQEIVRLEDWSAEKQRYELKQAGEEGSFAYRLKDGVQPPEPEHWICPQCYQDGKKSILKHESLPVGRAETLVCTRCDYDIVTRGVRHEQKRATFSSGRVIR